MKLLRFLCIVALAAIIGLSCSKNDSKIIPPGDDHTKELKKIDSLLL